MASTTDTEKAPSATEGSSPTNERDLDEIGETKGYIVDVSLVADKSLVEGLKLSKDGHTVLIPQPSSDSNDTLNWSWTKKHVMLIIISMTAFLPDYGSATGAVTVSLFLPDLLSFRLRAQIRERRELRCPLFFCVGDLAPQLLNLP
jgi:hypothetical protein